MTFYVINLMFFKFFCSFFACPAAGDQCFLGKFQLSGTCQLLQDCVAKDSLFRARYHLCNFQGAQPVVCCFEQAPTQITSKPTTEMIFTTQARPNISHDTPDEISTTTERIISTTKSAGENITGINLNSTTESPMGLNDLEKCREYSNIILSQMNLSGASEMQDVLEVCIRTFKALEAYKKIDIRDISRVQMYG